MNVKMKTAQTWEDANNLPMASKRATAKTETHYHITFPPDTATWTDGQRWDFWINLGTTLSVVAGKSSPMVDAVSLITPTAPGQTSSFPETVPPPKIASLHEEVLPAETVTFDGTTLPFQTAHLRETALPVDTASPGGIAPTHGTAQPQETALPRGTVSFFTSASPQPSSASQAASSAHETTSPVKNETDLPHETGSPRTAAPTSTDLSPGTTAPPVSTSSPTEPFSLKTESPEHSVPPTLPATEVQGGATSELGHDAQQHAATQMRPLSTSSTSTTEQEQKEQESSEEPTQEEEEDRTEEVEEPGREAGGRFFDHEAGQRQRYGDCRQVRNL